MSSAATNLGPVLVAAKSDFWELTNFGTNIIGLNGYTFSDLDSDPTSRVGDPFVGRFLNPGESMILVRTDTTTTRTEFTNWWGGPALNLQVRFYPKRIGFDSSVDAVQLFDPNGVLVDRVDFGKAFRGHTFVYDPQTGELGNFSTPGVNGAFKAVQADDFGTPGTTTGPVPLSITQQPAGLTQDAGLDAEFSVRANGLPRPAFQWLLNGTNLPGATKSSLTVTSAQPGHAGNYTVRINNGLTSLLSATATLVIHTNPSPAVVLVPPSDAIVFEGQTAVFSVRAGGFPPATFQWMLNGGNIPGATNNSLTVPMAALAWSGRIYSVTVQNIYGATNVSARLFVTRPPILAITEVMASVAGGTPSGHTDWFELTNVDTNAVNLLGYRFSDRYSFDLSFRITNSLVLQPGESALFVERLTPEEFKQWWGQDALPPGVKITTYIGLGLSSDGDVINFWNSAETDPYLPVVSAGFLQSLPGISQRFIPPDFYFVEDSMVAVAGAFRAVNGGDVGSPGYTTNPSPRFVSMTRDASGFTLKCRCVEGKQYALQSKEHLTNATWVTVGTYSATNSVILIPQPASAVGERFFLLLSSTLGS